MSESSDQHTAGQWAQCSRQSDDRSKHPEGSSPSRTREGINDRRIDLGIEDSSACALYDSYVDQPSRALGEASCEACHQKCA
jgi:hypothetical protein